MASNDITRRGFIKSTGGVLAFTVGNSVVSLTPAQARASNARLQLLSTDQANTLETLADAIVPGAKQAGVANFIDHQLAVEPSESLLMMRYLGVPAPYAGFYQSSLGSAERLAQASFSKPVADLSAEQLDGLVNKISTDSDSNWKGPPASFFYFVLRSDAIDMVYGTKAGFEKLGVPAMLHIEANEWW